MSSNHLVMTNLTSTRSSMCSANFNSLNRTIPFVSTGSFSATRSTWKQRSCQSCTASLRRVRFSESRRGFRVNAMMDEGELVPDVDEGTRVKVTQEITVFHAPKTKELQLQGREGVVKSIVKKYKGKETSANLPYRIQFELEQEGGKQSKFFAHLGASEFEKID